MINFLYGLDHNRILAHQESLLKSFATQQIPVHSIDLHDNSLKELRDLLQARSFFNEKKVIILKNAFNDSVRISEIIKDFDLINDPSVIIVIIEFASQTELNKKDKALVTLLAKAPSVSQTFNMLTGRDLDTWLMQEIQQYKLTISRPALQKLILYATIPPDQKIRIARIDSGKLQQECLKLANYAHSQNTTTISEEAIEYIVTPIIQNRMFDLTDAMANQDKARSLRLLHKALEDRVEPQSIVAMLCYQFRNIITIKSLAGQHVASGDMAIITKLHPYVIQKSQAQATRFSLEQLRRLYESLFDMDNASKNGTADLVDSLYEFVFSLN